MIDVERSEGVWTVALNRPDKANALTEEMLSRLAEIMRSAQDAKAVVLTGRGKVFSAGADLEAARAGLATSDVWEEVSDAIAALPCLSIACLNGTLAGGAFGMALACDIRISVPEAKFFYPVMKLGFLPQPSDPSRLVALVGPARAKMILMAGQKLSSEEALSYGLVDRLVKKDRLMEEAYSLTSDSVSASPDIVRGIKAMCR